MCVNKHKKKNREATYSSLLFLSSTGMDGSRTHHSSRRPVTDFEDRETHRDLTTPTVKHIEKHQKCQPWSCIFEQINLECLFTKIIFRTIFLLFWRSQTISWLLFNYFKTQKIIQINKNSLRSKQSLWSMQISILNVQKANLKNPLHKN